MQNGGGGNAATPVPLVQGEVEIADRVPAFSNAALHVTLEDVSRADSASRVVAETVIQGVRHDGGSGQSTRIAYTLKAPPGAARIDPRNDYSVRAWMDRDGDGQQGPGDLQSDQSYPVLTRGFGRTATITLGG